MGTRLSWLILPTPRSATTLASIGLSTPCTSTGNAEDSPAPEGRPAVSARVGTAPTTSREEVIVLPGSTGTCSVSSATVKRDKCFVSLVADALLRMVLNWTGAFIYAEGALRNK